jgi:hypothetical protein
MSPKERLPCESDEGFDELHGHRSLPRENTRFIVPRVHSEANIVLMRTHVNEHAELVFNLDQVGSSDWEDQNPERGSPLGLSQSTTDAIQSPAMTAREHFLPVYLPTLTL